VDVFSRLTLVRDKQGQPRSVFAINTDITERSSSMRASCRRSGSKAWARWPVASPTISTTSCPDSHGLGHPADKAQTDSERNMLTTMEACAQRGAGIIRQVLTFARGVEGKRIPLQPRHLLSEIAAIAGETFPKNIELEMDVEKELWPVLGDATQLHQVLMNLCVNARDAMPEGGRLGLNAENIDLDETFALMTPGAKSGPYVHLSIFDTGTGIPPELFNKIFDPFFTTRRRAREPVWVCPRCWVLCGATTVSSSSRARPGKAPALRFTCPLLLTSNRSRCRIFACRHPAARAS